MEFIQDSINGCFNSVGLKQVKGFCDALRAEVLYPVDYIRNVDRGCIAVGQFNFEKEIAIASALASLQAGKIRSPPRQGFQSVITNSLKPARSCLQITFGRI